MKVVDRRECVGAPVGGATGPWAGSIISCAHNRAFLLYLTELLSCASCAHAPCSRPTGSGRSPLSASRPAACASWPCCLCWPASLASWPWAWACCSPCCSCCDLPLPPLVLLRLLQPPPGRSALPPKVCGGALQALQQESCHACPPPRAAEAHHCDALPVSYCLVPASPDGTAGSTCTSLTGCAGGPQPIWGRPAHRLYSTRRCPCSLP